MIIRDKFGNKQTWAWLVANFGPLVIEEPPSPTYLLAELRENDDLKPTDRRPAGLPAGHVDAPAAIICTVLDADGQPLPGIDLVFSWPDAPPAPGAGWDGKGVIGRTKENGCADFAMGGGAYYDPSKTRGPHDLWIFGPGQSPCLRGLGMIAGSNHRHLDTVWQVATQPPPPPPPPPHDLRFHLCHAISQALAVADLLAEAVRAQDKVTYHLTTLRELLSVDCDEIP